MKLQELLKNIEPVQIIGDAEYRGFRSEHRLSKD